MLRAARLTKILSGCSSSDYGHETIPVCKVVSRDVKNDARSSAQPSPPFSPPFLPGCLRRPSSILRPLQAHPRSILIHLGVEVSIDTMFYDEREGKERNKAHTLLALPPPPPSPSPSSTQPIVPRFSTFNQTSSLKDQLSPHLSSPSNCPNA